MLNERCRIAFTLLCAEASATIIQLLPQHKYACSSVQPRLLHTTHMCFDLHLAPCRWRGVSACARSWQSGRLQERAPLREHHS
jgi:hypothetical protein